jgi:hypothetical protein
MVPIHQKRFVLMGTFNFDFLMNKTNEKECGCKAAD